jgi:CoA-transferase family III
MTSRDGSRALEVAARCGAMALTGAADGPPLQVPDGIVLSAQMATDAIRGLTLGAVRLDGPALLGERAASEGLRRSAPWSVGGRCRALRTDDGWLAVSLSRQSDLDSVPAVVGDDAEITDHWKALEGWVARRGTDEAIARIRLLEIPTSAIPASGAEQPRTQGIVARRLDGGPDVVVAERSDPRPLVVDLSSLWAGPLCAHVLGLAGYRVVKVESADRPDGARRGSPAFYDLLHAGHESVVLDFTTDAGLRSLRLLLARADVVIEASRPRALLGLGITPEPLLRPGGVWLGITAHGRSGDEARLVGFGDDVAAGAGAWVVDPGTATPVPSCDAVADPLTGLLAARAVLEARSRGGRWFLDAAMSRVTAEAVGPTCTPVARAATWREGEWWSSAAGDGVPVAQPRARRPSGSSADFGQHTAAVLGELEGAGAQ